ncbi:hypothetical protein F5Y10DRAFT_260889 [Nemania abortiva]|nr:hypothetical protein F5Y10DRAFT_260889 [Nemania abortiva]
MSRDDTESRSHGLAGSWDEDINMGHENRQLVDGINSITSIRAMLVDTAAKSFEASKDRWLSRLGSRGPVNWGTTLFACPFAKSKTCRNLGCLKTTGFKTRGDFANHLNSAHSQPLYCPICMLTFHHDSIRDSHIRERSCQRTTFIPFDGMSIRERTEILFLLRISPEKSLDKVYWYKAWDILFPNQPRPDSPFIERNIEITITVVRMFWVDYGPKLIAEFLVSRGVLAWRIVNEKSALVGLYTDVLSELTDRYLRASLENGAQ